MPTSIATSKPVRMTASTCMRWISLRMISRRSSVA